MSANQKTPADVIVEHPWLTMAYKKDPEMLSRCLCGWTASIVNSHKTGIRLHAEHLIDVLAEEVGVPGKWVLAAKTPSGAEDVVGNPSGGHALGGTSQRTSSDSAPEGLSL